MYSLFARKRICSEAGSYLRLINSCITQLKAQVPSRTCNESKEEDLAGEEDVLARLSLSLSLARARSVCVCVVCVVCVCLSLSLSRGDLAGEEDVLARLSLSLSLSLAACVSVCLCLSVSLSLSLSLSLSGPFAPLPSLSLTLSLYLSHSLSFSRHSLSMSLSTPPSSYQASRSSKSISSIRLPIRSANPVNFFWGGWGLDSGLVSATSRPIPDTSMRDFADH